MAWDNLRPFKLHQDPKTGLWQASADNGLTWKTAHFCVFCEERARAYFEAYFALELDGIDPNMIG